MNQSNVDQVVQEFVGDLVRALGLDLSVAVEHSDEGIRVNLADGDGEPLLRRKGEGLDALQHVVNAAFRDTLSDHQRIVIDCQGFRRAKDRELQQMAHFVMDKVRATGIPQELGPLNSYARRLVHLEVAGAPDLASESQGDGAVKMVVITRRPGA